MSWKTSEHWRYFCESEKNKGESNLDNDRDNHKSRIVDKTESIENDLGGNEDTPREHKDNCSNREKRSKVFPISSMVSSNSKHHCET